MSCGVGEYCVKNTECDYRVTPGYGITFAPAVQPSLPPLPYDARENFMFCGEKWEDANSNCKQWCGDRSECPGSQR